MTVLEEFGQPSIHARAGAIALECVHTYSLIHDDLPCMDDDRLRRGQLTSHLRFGEAKAVLAGDALLTAAFELLGTEPSTVAGGMVLELARASGMQGMVAGQILDMNGSGSDSSLEALEAIHRKKTGALISACLTMAGVRSHQSQEKIEQLRTLGYLMGLIFQVGDDILDVTSNAEALGKSVGKDEAQDKATYPALLGLDGAQKKLKHLEEEAHATLLDLNLASGDLPHILSFLATRQH
jgi:geranylgeranyl pyrophosphate synthase